MPRAKSKGERLNGVAAATKSKGDAAFSVPIPAAPTLMSPIRRTSQSCSDGDRLRGSGASRRSQRAEAPHRPRRGRPSRNLRVPPSFPSLGKGRRVKIFLPRRPHSTEFPTKYLARLLKGYGHAWTPSVGSSHCILVQQKGVRAHPPNKNDKETKTTYHAHWETRRLDRHGQGSRFYLWVIGIAPSGQAVSNGRDSRVSTFHLGAVWSLAATHLFTYLISTTLNRISNEILSRLLPGYCHRLRL